MSLTPRQQRFVEEYLVDLNATQAAIRAGYSPKTAEQQGSRLLSNAKVAQAISVGRQALSERTEITQDMVLKRLWDIANADPNEISQYRRNACRYCHGHGHRYQWRDEAEWEDAYTLARSKKKPKPTDEGGFGFDQNAEPHPNVRAAMAKASAGRSSLTHGC